MRVVRTTLLFAVTVLLVSCADREPAPIDRIPEVGDATLECCAVTLRVEVPAGTDTVYVAGSLPGLGPWDPSGLAMGGSGTERVALAHVAPGTDFEYKFTLGSWDTEALGPEGGTPPNHRLVVQEDTVAIHVVDAFRNPLAWMEDWEGSGVEGRLVYWTDVESEFLGPARHVEVWLPPGYEENPEIRYPVLYMSDGQNLFDPRLSGTGVDWGVDEAVVRLSDAGLIPPVIVVGVWNTEERAQEYSPWHAAPAYARFLIEELMPRVDAEFRTLTGPENTAVMGSSMGGLLSFYLVTQRSDVFGSCGCLSTPFMLSEAMWGEILGPIENEAPDRTPYIVHDLEAGLTVPRGARYWFDFGTEGLDSLYGPTQETVRQWLLGQGLIEGEDFVVRKYEGANHDEASWRARLDDPLTFLFGYR